MPQRIANNDILVDSPAAAPGANWQEKLATAGGENHIVIV